MLADDGFSWLNEPGGLTRANGDRFRDMVLSLGLVIPSGVAPKPPAPMKR